MICITASQTEVSTSGRKEWTKMFCSVNARRSTIRQFSGPRLANKCLKEDEEKSVNYNKTKTKILDLGSISGQMLFGWLHVKHLRMQPFFESMVNARSMKLLFGAWSNGIMFQKIATLTIQSVFLKTSSSSLLKRADEYAFESNFLLTTCLIDLLLDSCHNGIISEERYFLCLN